MYLPSRSPWLIMLVGIPGCGKSTWAQWYLNELILRDLYLEDPVIISSDKFIEERAKQEGTTYDKVFNDTIKVATSNMYTEKNQAVAHNKNIIWDQTNITTFSRISKLRTIPKEYYKVALVWEPKEEYLNHKTERPDKHIPKEVLWDMYHRYQPPLLTEGFNQIIFHDGSF